MSQYTNLRESEKTGAELRIILALMLQEHHDAVQGQAGGIIMTAAPAADKGY